MISPTFVVHECFRVLFNECGGNPIRCQRLPLALDNQCSAGNWTEMSVRLTVDEIDGGILYTVELHPEKREVVCVSFMVTSEDLLLPEDRFGERFILPQMTVLANMLKEPN